MANDRCDNVFVVWEFQDSASTSKPTCTTRFSSSEPKRSMQVRGEHFTIDIFFDRNAYIASGLEAFANSVLHLLNGFHYVVHIVCCCNRQTSVKRRKDWQNVLLNAYLLGHTDCVLVLEENLKVKRCQRNLCVRRSTAVPVTRTESDSLAQLDRNRVHPPGAFTPGASWILN